MSQTVIAAVLGFALPLLTFCTAGAQEIRRDAHGDPLPQHAVCRLGTTRLFHPELRALAFSPNGRLLATAGEVTDKRTYKSSGLVRLWEVPSGKLQRAFESPAVCWSVAFAPQGDLLASGDEDHAIHLWQISTGKLVREFRVAPDDTPEPDDRNHLWNVVFSHNGERLAARDFKGVYVWETATGRKLQTLTDGERGELKPLGFVDDGKSLLAVRAKRHLAKYDVATGEQQYTVEAAPADKPDAEFPSLGVVFSALSPDGEAIATFAEDDEGIRIFATATGKQLRVIKDAELAGPLQFTPDGKTLLAVLEDGGIYRLQDDGQERLRSPRRMVLGDYALHAARCFSPDGRWLAEMDITAFGANGRVELWDVEKNQFATRFLRVGRFIQLSRNGARLIAHLGDDFTAWDTTSGEELLRFGPSAKVRQFEKRNEIYPETVAWRRAGFLPDGKTAVVACGDLRAVDVETGVQKTLVSMDAFGGYIFEAYLSPDGASVAMSGGGRNSEGSIRLWNLKSRRFVQTFRASGATNVTFAPDSKYLVTQNQEKQRIRLWNAATGRLAREVQLQSKVPAYRLEMTTDSFLTLSRGVFAFDLSGANRREVVQSQDEIISWAISANGRMLAATHATGEVRLWDLTSGRKLRTIQAHPQLHMAGDVSFSADGKRLATSDFFGEEVLVWDLEAMLADDSP